MLVKAGLSIESIEIAESATSAEGIIKLLAARIAIGLSVRADMIERAVLDREHTRTTAFPNGAALPHCRLPDLPRFGIGMMILRKPVRWDVEGHAVDVILMIAGPTASVSDHLRILANGSQLLDSPALRAKLKRVPGAEAAYELLTAAEEAIEQRRAQLGLLREVRRDQENGGDFLASVAEKFDW